MSIATTDRQREKHASFAEGMRVGEEIKEACIRNATKFLRGDDHSLKRLSKKDRENAIKEVTKILRSTKHELFG